MRQFIVADDLTGASDAGIQCVKSGARTVVWLDYSQPVDGDADVVVLDTDSRLGTPAAAYARVSTLLRRLDVAGPREVLKKIDSTLRGNFGSETQALIDGLPDAFAIVCPAYPKNGRTSLDGTLYVHGTRVDETDFGRDLFTPVRNARIAAHFDVQSTVFDLATVRGGVEVLSGAIDAARAAGIRIAIVDAESDDDLRALGRLDKRRRDLIWAGSAGIIEMLDHGRSGATQAAPAASGSVLFLIGSLSEMTQRQIYAFRRHALVEELDPSAILKGDPGVNAAVERVRLALERGEHALLAMDGERSAVTTALAFGEALGWTVRVTSQRLRAAFIVAVAPLVKQRPGTTFVLSGGDIARSFCDAFGIRAMTLLAEIVPGIPVSRAIGAEAFLVTKAGGFGRPETYHDILTALEAKVPI